MKKYLLAVAVFMTGLVFLNFNLKSEKAAPVAPSETEFSIPADVQSVLDNSCYGCHNSDSKNTKGKAKIKFDELGSLKTSKLVGKMGKIVDVVNEGDMPPKKFLENKPKAALSEEQKVLLVNWAESIAKSYSE